jgi:hypothetical protein
LTVAPASRFSGFSTATNSNKFARGDRRIALANLLFQHPEEVEPGRNAIDVHEQLLGRKSLLQSVKQAACIARIVRGGGA